VKARLDVHHGPGVRLRHGLDYGLMMARARNDAAEIETLIRALFEEVESGASASPPALALRFLGRAEAPAGRGAAWERGSARRFGATAWASNGRVGSPPWTQSVKYM